MTVTTSASRKHTVTRLQVSSNQNDPERNSDLGRALVEVDEGGFREEWQRAWKSVHAAVRQDIGLGVSAMWQAIASLRASGETSRERLGISAGVRVRGYHDAAVLDVSASQVGHDREGPPSRTETAGRGYHPTDRDVAYAPILPDIRTVSAQPQDTRATHAGVSDLAPNGEY